MRNMPIGMSKDMLVNVLEDILRRVKEGDSFEGSIEYLMPMPPCPGYDPVVHDSETVEGVHCQGCGLLQATDDKEAHDKAQDPEEADFMVRAAYRLGNATMGQGSLRMIGEMK